MDNSESNNWINEYSSGVLTALENARNRNKLISIAAYFLAEKRGFAPDNDLEDWFEAEREVQRHLDSFSS